MRARCIQNFIGPAFMKGKGTQYGQSPVRDQRVELPFEGGKLSWALPVESGTTFVHSQSHIATGQSLKKFVAQTTDGPRKIERVLVEEPFVLSNHFDTLLRQIVIKIWKGLPQEPQRFFLFQRIGH
jgi:hypothetical protein